MKPTRVVVALCLLGLAAVANAAKPAKVPGNDDCLTCHADREAKRSSGKPVVVAGAKFAASVHGKAGVSCVDCHADLAKAADSPHAARLAKVDCASCHDGAGASHPFHPEIARAAREKKEPQVACSDCHGTHEITGVKDPGFRFAWARQAQACGDCHDDTSKHFLTSDHGKAYSSGEKPSPACISCHRNPVTSGAGLSAADLKRVQERLCLSCHLYDESVKSRAAPTAGFIASFEHSVHGTALRQGDARAPGCVDCHGAHDQRRGIDTSSFVNKMQVQQVCARCHAAENRQFTASVHGAAVRKGIHDAPACTDCHGEHSILSPKDPRSPVAAANVSTQVCSPCHASMRVTERWNLPRDRTRTFSESYHGLASRGGVIEVANCASCHGAHHILPSSNPASRVNRANLASTCGASGCHPGANSRFALGSVHVTENPGGSPLLFWIATIYVVLIVATIGGMFLHNFLDFLRKSRRQLAIRRGEILQEHAGRGLYLRMTLAERLQHGSLGLSFLALVVTGFMLRYPESWWVLSVRRVWPGVFDARSVVHRAAAVVMVAASLYHVAYLSFAKRGRELLRDLWWRRRDFTDAIGTMRYNLGLSSGRPRFDRFSYIEKSEYWALVWGTAVMAATGFAMWFDNKFIGLLTKLGYDIARTIHFYEAWLATLAILVWHVYFVVFNPDAYPMNMAWLTGKLSEKEMEEEHPLELERIRAKEAPKSDILPATEKA